MFYARGNLCFDFIGNDIRNVIHFDVDRRLAHTCAMRVPVAS